MHRSPQIRSSVILFLALSFGMLFSGCTIALRDKKVAGLQVSSTNGTAEVFLNGESVGSTPFSDQQLKPGEYALKLVAEDDGLGSYETTIELFKGTLSVVDWSWEDESQESGGMIIEVEPIQTRSGSELSIRSNPDGAIIKVDDTSQGFAPVLMKGVTAGAHRYSVSLPGYVEQSHTVTAIDGFRMNIALMLAKEKEQLSQVAESTQEAEVQDGTSSARVASQSAAISKKTSTPTPKKSTNTERADDGTVTIIETGTGWLRVRETPNTSGKELAKVDVGETFPITDTENGWYEIEYEEGETGWVIGTFVKKNEN